MDFFKKSPLIYIVSFSAFSERFIYYGTLTILVLFLTTKFQLSDDASYVIYGLYATLSYLLPLIGGYLADKYFDRHKTVTLGILLIGVGNIFLLFSHIDLFFIGLSMALIGIGLYKTNSLALIGSLTTEDSAQREDGYTIYYTSMNIGATISPLVYGVIIASLGWNYCFLLNIVLIVPTFLFFIIHPVRAPEQGIIQKNKDNVIIILGICCALGVNYLLFSYLFLYDYIGVLLILLPVLFFVSITNKISLTQRKAVLGILILYVLTVVFYATSLQVGSSINLFIEDYIERTIFDIEIPANTFTMLFPLSAVLLVAPVTAFWRRIKLEKSTIYTTRIVFGILCVVAAFIFFSTAAYSPKEDSALTSLTWIVLGNIFLGMGEISIVPAVYSIVSLHAPLNIQGTMIGLFHIFIAIGGFFSGIIAQWNLQKSPWVNLISVNNQVFNEYFYKFAFIAFLALLTVLISLALHTTIRKLLNASK
jgi:POT family proton-dependent oligopeptide transporter